MIFQTDNFILNNTGFKEPKRVIFGRKRDYLRGDGHILGGKLRPDGQWIDDISQLALEVQNKYCETMHCWIWNTIKAVCLLIWVKYQKKVDYSERFSGVMGGATVDGGSPHNGCETIRKDGLINQEELPWTSDLNSFWKFSAPRPMLQKYIDLGKKWLREYSFYHDWVVWPTIIGNLKRKFGYNVEQIIDKNIVDMVEALKDSPLGVGVLAWQTRNGLAYKNWNQGDNHWTLIVGYIYGQYWIVYDSYLDCWRKLEWRYPFKWVKRYTVDETGAAQRDADYIKKNYWGMNVKGSESPAIYYIFNGKKEVYKSMDDYEYITSTYKLNPYIVVSQDALDLIEEGEPRDRNKIAGADWGITPADDKPKIPVGLWERIINHFK